jgi:hypothetical protein
MSRRSDPKVRHYADLTPILTPYAATTLAITTICRDTSADLKALREIASRWGEGGGTDQSLAELMQNQSVQERSGWA